MKINLKSIKTPEPNLAKFRCPVCGEWTATALYCQPDGYRWQLMLDCKACNHRTTPGHMALARVTMRHWRTRARFRWLCFWLGVKAKVFELRFGPIPKYDEWQEEEAPWEDNDEYYADFEDAYGDFNDPNLCPNCGESTLQYDGEGEGWVQVICHHCGHTERNEG